MHRLFSKKAAPIKTKFSYGNTSKTYSRSGVDSKMSLSSSPPYLLRIAKISRPFGIRGLVFAKLTNPDFLDILDNLLFRTSCVISKSPNLKNFLKVLELKKHKSGILIKVENFNTRDMVESIIGGFVFSNYSFKKSLYLTEMTGFVLYDGNQKLGKIKSVYHNNAHGILMLDKVEVPFVDGFIKNINWENKKIVMNLPKGLYEI